MELTIESIKEEHDRVLDASLALNTKSLWTMMQAAYNLGLQVGEMNGRLKTLDELTELLEQANEQSLSHTDGIRSNGQSGSAE